MIFHAFGEDETSMGNPFSSSQQSERQNSSDSTSKILTLHKGYGGPGRFMKKVFGDSCTPQCGDGEKGFSILVASDAECPTDIEDRQAIKNVFKAFKKNFCDPEVRNYLSIFTLIFLIARYQSNLQNRLIQDLRMYSKQKNLRHLAEKEVCTYIDLIRSVCKY